MSRSLRIFSVEQFGHVNKENTSDKKDKLIIVNPVGYIESFGSSVNSTLLVETVEVFNKLFTFVES